MKHLKKLIAIAILLLTMFSCGKDDDTITETQDCELVFISNGLSASDCGLYQYVSDSGVTIKINAHGVITYTDTSTFPNIFTIQFWGTDGTDKGYAYAGLENLNGKHIKDRFGINRTILHPNGLKITLISTGTFPYIAGEDYFTGATIYDGAIVHHIDLVTNHIEYSGNNQYVADNVDANEADGETSTYEVVGTMLYYYNIYTENELGNKIIERVDLGSLNSLDPNQVNDLFDDPRLNHT
jgi:hypothetical protein